MTIQEFERQLKDSYESLIQALEASRKRLLENRTRKSLIPTGSEKYFESFLELHGAVEEMYVSSLRVSIKDQERVRLESYSQLMKAGIEPIEIDRILEPQARYLGLAKKYLEEA